MVVAASPITLSPASFLRSAGTCFLPPRRLMSLRVPSFVGFQVSSLPPKQSSKLQVRAARTESSSVSLGPRAPYFELPEPLTGKVWKLDDFESNPAFLIAFMVICKMKLEKVCTNLEGIRENLQFKFNGLLRDPKGECALHLG